jgi:hypothetical protein
MQIGSYGYTTLREPDGWALGFGFGIEYKRKCPSKLCDSTLADPRWCNAVIITGELLGFGVRVRIEKEL